MSYLFVGEQKIAWEGFKNRICKKQKVNGMTKIIMKYITKLGYNKNGTYVGEYKDDPRRNRNFP